MATSRSPGLLNNHEKKILEEPLIQVTHKGGGWYNCAVEPNFTGAAVMNAVGRLACAFFLARAFSLGGACYHTFAGVADLAHAFAYYNQSSIQEVKTKEDGAINLAASGIEHLISAVYNCVFLLDTLYVVTAAFTLLPGVFQGCAEYVFGAPKASSKEGEDDVSNNGNSEFVSVSGPNSPASGNSQFSNNNNNVVAKKPVEEISRARYYALSGAKFLFEKVTVAPLEN